MTNPNPKLKQVPSSKPNTSRTTLGRFDIQAEADLHAAVVNVQFNKRLAASFGTAEVVMIATVASELGTQHPQIRRRPGSLAGDLV